MKREVDHYVVTVEVKRVDMLTPESTAGRNYNAPPVEPVRDVVDHGRLSFSDTSLPALRARLTVALDALMPEASQRYAMPTATTEAF